MSPPNGTTLPAGERYVPLPKSPEEAEDVDDTTTCDCSKSLCKPTEESTPLKDKLLDEEIIDTELVVPPDGGWGWVVVLGSFACNMIVDGIIFSFSSFLPGIANDLEATTTQVTLVGSLLSGFYLIAGPFVSALANRFGFRIVAIAGSVLGALAFVMSYFAASVEFLCFSYGIVGGIGFGLIYVPAVITVGFYFEKYRALATGIGVCGSGIGTFVFAPLTDYIIQTYGWRIALLCQAAIILSCAIFGFLFRPVKPTKLKELDGDKLVKPTMVVDKQKLSLATKLKLEKALQGYNGRNSMGSIHDSQSTIPRILGVNNNADYPTVYDVYHTISVPQNCRPEGYNAGKRFSVPLITDEDKPKAKTPQLQAVFSNRRDSVKRERTFSESRSKSHRGALDINRPMYRDDIFFGASLSRLPQYTSRTSVAYHLSVTRLPTKADIQEEKEHTCKLCPEAFRRTLATMLDFSLLKSPSFLLMAVSGAFTMMGFYVPFMYLKGRAESHGIAEVAAWLISAIGIANTIGRVLCGVLSSFPSVNALLVNNAALTIGGIATVFSGFSMTQEYQFTYCVVFGLSISCFASLRPVLVVELLGLEKLTNAFGLLLLFQGVAATIGSPLAGAFMEATGSYDASFYLSGSLILASAIMCYPLNAINRWELRRQSKTSAPVPV